MATIDDLEVIADFVEMELEFSNKVKLNVAPKKDDYFLIQRYLIGKGYDVNLVAETDIKRIKGKKYLPNYSLVITEDKKNA